MSAEFANIVDSQVTDHLSLEEICAGCLEKGLACAVYQLPKSGTKHLIIDLSSGGKIDRLDLDEIGEGFIFHPFSKEDHPAAFINKDIHIVENETSRKPEILYSRLGAQDLKEFPGVGKRPGANKDAPVHGRISIKSSTESQKDSFISLVDRTILEIEKESFQKAVIARIKDIDLPDRFNPFDLFHALSDRYRNAFVYFTYIPGIGSWIGATPEPLIRIDRARKFKTVALAATQAKQPGQDPEDTTWSQKDIEEQAMVSRYIINCFKKIRLREFEEIGPKTYLSGNLVHLRTEYRVDMDQVGFPQLGTVMLELLHPTSAVCGMPKEPSMKFIEIHEDFDREYFSGFLGPVNIREETDIFVNLRCMKIAPGKARLYAGAGIISNSTPEKEWNETEIKMETILRVLKALR
ncbi:MAG: chorismate-binding protein [Cytophagales bacterium]|nr:chorismate-binding protein [Cytophagales bacterium]